MTTHLKSRPVVIFRAVTKADVNILSRLIRRYYAFDHLFFDPKAIRAGLQLLLKNASNGRAFLILHESKAVGYALLTYGFDLEFGGRTALMTDLYLEPPYRGIGIGTRMTQFLERFCRKEGMNTLELQVERRNTRALSFYERCGFHAHNRIPMSKYLRLPR